MRILRTISILMVAVLICGCSKSDENVKLLETQFTITAGFADNDNTKTTLQDTGVYWEVGDEIKVFYGDGYGRFTSTNTEVVKKASFSGSINTVIGSEEGFAGGEYMWGLYPYRSDATYDGTVVTTTIPHQQTGKAGSFAKNMNISLAKSSNLALAFYNVCGGLRFTVTRDDITDVVFEGRNNEDLAGTIQVAFSEGVPFVQSLTGGKKKITLKAPNSETFESGKWYYIVAVPGTLTNGFKLTLNTATQYAELVKTNSVTVKRGIFGSVEDADEGLVFQTKTTPSGDNIVFNDIVAKVACVEKFDTNSDGEVSYAEAAAVTSIAGLFTDYNSVTRFDELKYFTGITSLGSALKNLKSLRSVTIPAQFTTLDDYAFVECSALDSVTFAGDVVKTIGPGAFRSCTSLKGITLPSAVESLGQYAFYECSDLESVEIPSGVTSIPDHCFHNCYTLKTVSIPSGVKSIGDSSFSGCYKLESVDLPSGLTSVGNGAFASCEKIRTVSLPNTVTSLGSGAFSGCTSLESATLPSGLTFLSSSMFYNCTNLYSVTFPTALASIESSAFYNCPFYNPSTNVSKVDLPETVTSIEDFAFNRVRNVLVHSSAMVSIGANTFSTEASLYVPDSNVETYKIRTNWSSYADHIYALSSYTDTPMTKVVDLGLSVKWASCNVGALFPEDCGDYYAWGETETKSDYSWGTYRWCNGSSTSMTKYCTSSKYGTVDNKTVLESSDDVAHVKWGGDWRMPTADEWKELYDNCIWTWTKVGGMNGYKVTSQKAGYTGKSIFLPAAGYRNGTILVNVVPQGYYWSSCTIGSDFALDCWFGSDHVYPRSNIDFRDRGRTVRPVTE